MRQSIQIESHCHEPQACLALCYKAKAIKLSENVEPRAEHGTRFQLRFGVAEAREVSGLGVDDATLC